MAKKPEEVPTHPLTPKQARKRRADAVAAKNEKDRIRFITAINTMLCGPADSSKEWELDKSIYHGIASTVIDDVLAIYRTNGWAVDTGTVGFYRIRLSEKS